MSRAFVLGLMAVSLLAGLLLLLGCDPAEGIAKNYGEPDAWAPYDGGADSDSDSDSASDSDSDSASDSDSDSDSGVDGGADGGADGGN